MSITVVKIGGSLLQSQTLLSWLHHIKQFSLNQPVIIVPGGGVFADNVRDLQLKFNFDDKTAHQMALMAMSQYAYLLKGLSPDFQLINDIGKIESGLDLNLPLIWLPDYLMGDFSEVPPSWDFTSDSIALWLAIKLKAEHLVLVKSTSTDSNIDVNLLVKDGKIDKGFQTLIKHYQGKIMWLRKDQFTSFTSVSDLAIKALEVPK